MKNFLASIVLCGSYWVITAMRVACYSAIKYFGSIALRVFSWQTSQEKKEERFSNQEREDG